MASTTAKLLVIGYTAAASTFCGASGAYALTKTSLKDPQGFEAVMRLMVLARNPAASSNYIAENLVGAKACLIPASENSDEMFISLEGYDTTKFEMALTYSRSLHGYNGWGTMPFGTYRQETVCLFDKIPGAKDTTLGNMSSTMMLSSVKMNNSIISMASTIYHEHMHAIWAILNTVRYGTTEGDEMLREVGLDEANAFTRTFLALQIRKLTTTDKRDAADIQKHLSEKEPEASKAFDQLVQLYSKEALLENLKTTGMFPQELNRIIFMKMMEGLIDRDYGQHAHEHATPDTDASITINDTQIGMTLNFDMPFYGQTTSWGGFTTHVATHLPIIERLKKLAPNAEKPLNYLYGNNRQISHVASFAGMLNAMIDTAKKSWDWHATIAADQTGLLYSLEAVKADFIRSDLRALVEVAIKRVENAKDLSPALKEKLSQSFMILSMNLVEPPTIKGDAAPHYGTEAALKSQQFFSFIKHGSPCVQFTPSIALDFITNIRENPLTGNDKFHQYLEKLAAESRKKLGRIQTYSPELKTDLTTLIDDVVMSVKFTRPLTVDKTLRGLTRSQQRQRCG